jgi:hypothetical protein
LSAENAEMSLDLPPAFSRRAVLAAIGGGAGSLFLGAALADQPPAAPRDVTAHSPAGRFEARSLARGETQVWRGRSLLWSVPEASPYVFVSDEGPTLALLHRGGNLLPLGSGGETIVARFFRDGALTRSVRLDEVMEPSRLRPTVSHLAWGRALGFERDGRLRLETVDGRTVRLSP